MAHYWIEVKFDTKEMQNIPTPIIYALQNLNGKYEVVETVLWLDEGESWARTSFASIREGKTAPVAGSSYLNPHDEYKTGVGRKVAFKRAVMQIIDKVIADRGLKTLHRVDKQFTRIAMSEFRRLRSINLVILEEGL